MTQELKAYILLYFYIALLLVISSSAILLAPIPQNIKIFKMIVSLIVFITPLMMIFKIFEIGGRK